MDVTISREEMLTAFKTNNKADGVEIRKSAQAHIVFGILENVDAMVSSHS